MGKKRIHKKKLSRILSLVLAVMFAFSLVAVNTTVVRAADETEEIAQEEILKSAENEQETVEPVQPEADKEIQEETVESVKESVQEEETQTPKMVAVDEPELLKASEPVVGKVYWKVDGATLYLSNTSYAGDESDLLPEAMGSIAPWNDQKFDLTKVVIENEIKPTSTANYFNNLFYVKSIDNIENINSTNVTDMHNMFNNCRGLTSLNVSKLDTSKVTDMSSMFGSCRNLTSLDVSKFNTTLVTNMYQMFYNCRELQKLDLKNFNTAAVTNMSQMFYYCEKMSELDVTGFDTSKVTNMDTMFGTCNALTKLDLSSFDLSALTSYEMFKYTNAFEELKTPKTVNAVINLPHSDFLGTAIPVMVDAEGNYALEMSAGKTLTQISFNGQAQTINQSEDNRDIFNYLTENGSQKDGFCLEIDKTAPETAGEDYSAEIPASLLSDKPELWMKISNTLTLGYVYDKGDFVNDLMTNNNLDEATARRYLRMATQYTIWHYTNNVKGPLNAGNNGIIGNLVEQLIKKVEDENKTLMPDLKLNMVVPKNGKNQNILTYEVTYMVKVQKQDEEENGLAGAKLQIVTADGNSVSGRINGNDSALLQWSSAAEGDEISIQPGEYLLKEITAPEGYETAEDIAFTMDATGKITVDGEIVDTIVMVDRKKQVVVTEEKPKDDEGKTTTVENGNKNEKKSTNVSTKKQTAKATTKSIQTGDQNQVNRWIIFTFVSAVIVLGLGIFYKKTK